MNTFICLPLASDHRSRIQRPCGQRQQGVVLFLALITLVIITLSAISLLRSVDSTTLIAGNVAFRQVAASAADTGIEDAIGWLQSLDAASLDKLVSDKLGNASPTTRESAYFASWGTDPDLSDLVASKVYWAGAYKLTGKVAGNDIYYIIQRMCSATGAAGGANICPQYTMSSGGKTVSRRDCGYGSCPPAGSLNNQVMYRITARAVGPRNTQTFVQVLVN